MSDIIDLLDRYGLNRAISDAFTKGITSAVESGVKGILSEQGIQVAGAVADAAANLSGSVVALVLSMMIKSQDRVKEDLKALREGPFKTGMRTAEDGLKLVCKNVEEQEFRSDQLREAIHDLESAFDLVPQGPRYEAQRQYILFIQGLCSLQIPGGIPYSRSRLEPFARSLTARSRNCEEGCSALHSTWLEDTFGESSQLRSEMLAWFRDGASILARVKRLKRLRDLLGVPASKETTLVSKEYATWLTSQDFRKWIYGYQQSEIPKVAPVYWIVEIPRSTGPAESTEVKVRVDKVRQHGEALSASLAKVLHYQMVAEALMPPDAEEKLNDNN
ncbi:MAG: hypothetical protein JWL59_4302 [Chthoniobacteraceae bacterium]|nr:hypothetical protein [Chthoniobacteraceae bacterium]